MIDVWTMSEALELIARLQPASRNYNYHVCLGGGVLNNQRSNKDLDLYFLSLDNGVTDDSDGMLKYLSEQFGAHEPITKAEYAANSMYEHKVKFANGGQRIDAFIY
jgi:hypothetical protein